MDQKEKKKPGCRFKPFVIYTIAFAVMTAVVLCIFVLNGKSFVKMTDGVAQHFPVLCYIRDYLLNIFRSGSFDFPMVDFSVGQGFDIIGTLNYYGFGDPLTLLSVLFPGNALEAMYAFLIFLRVYLAGLGFMVFCRTLGQKVDTAVISGGLLYAFCSFTLVGGFKHPCFLNGLLYLPFLLLGIERIIRKKSILPLALTVACAFMSNYYFMYMNTILAGIYLLIRFLGHYREAGVKGFFRIVWKIILGYLWGICIAGVIFLPSVYAFLQNGREVSGGMDIPLFYDAEFYGNLWRSLANIPHMAGKWAVPGTGAVGIISMAVLIVKHPKKEKRLLIAAAVLGLMLGLPVFGSIMNGFSYVTNRWSYGFAFLLALTAARMLPYLKEMTVRQRSGVSALVVLYCLPFLGAFLAKGKEGNIRCVLVLLMSLALLLLMGWVVQKRKIQAASYVMIFVTLGGILWNASGSYLQEDGSGGFVPAGKVQEYLDHSSLSVLDSVEDSSFYRVEHHWNIMNFGLWEKKNPTNFYYSVVPKAMSELYTGVWLNAQERAYVLDSLDSRTALTALASVKYYVGSQKTSIPYGYREKAQVRDSGGTIHYLYENKNPLPLGYTYDTAMTREEYDKLEPLEKQQSLLEHAVVEDVLPEIPFHSGKPDAAISKKKVAVIKSKKAKWENGSLKVQKGGSITFGFDGDPDSETYLVLKGIRSNDAEHDGRSVQITSQAAVTRMKRTGKRHIAYLPKDGEILNLGYSENAQTECTITFGTKRTFRVDQIEVQCISMQGMEEMLQERKRESMEQVLAEGNRVTGNITVHSPKILQFSIPYSSGWKAYVDGKETETFASDIAYMGIFLKSGTHEILLEYTSPLIIPGAVLTLCGLALVLVYVVLLQKKRKVSGIQREGIS